MVLTMLIYDEGVISALKRVYGDFYRDFLEAITKPGSRLYLRVNTLKTSVGEIIDRLRGRGIDVYVDEELGEAIYIPIQGPYKVELHDKKVVVDKYAAESVYLGSHLYVPGVVKCSSDIEKGDEVSIVSENGVVVGEGIAMLSCSEMLERKKGLAVKTIRSVYRAPPIRELPEYREGLIYPQSLPAMYVSRVVDPKPGEIIVDMCAAPGGKTGHMVELSRGKAYIFAFDHSRKRIEEMKNTLDRLGYRQLVEIWRADSRYLHIDFPWIKADKILIDPPCSALGVRPKIYDRKSYSDIVSASRYQIQFLKSASIIVKIGGIIVYSTCTVTVEENEDVIERFINENRCFDVIDTNISRGSRGVFGDNRELYTRFHPHIHDTTGYFIAKIKRKC
ncbi:Fmu (Sun) domain protein [Ignisphaera aggregans DSM 17230]|uniref:tRNA (cytosine(72)-C(5))-methyltransferase n=1 Tax=Ignisphaera aggregans (strain DSM 17230 / JCM 13409 / AQ1.S1) TaxID=583356 RepID=E0SPP1_IGNAA|nr:Fmu (Sun) domain protein [Ignisphaera aggregans DSM 17230]